MQRDLAADVVVMGGGIAGLVAAVRAAQFGLHAIVLEKLTDARYVCNSRITGGIFHFANRSILNEPALLARQITEASDSTVDARLVEAVTGDVLRAVRWLQAAGVRFIRASGAEYQAFVLAPPAVQHVGWPWRGRSGDVLLPILEEQLTRLGGRLLRGHRVTELLMRDGCCVGLRGTDRNDNDFQAQARAVVLADGGFQANHRMLREHVSRRPERLVQRNAQTGLGDALRLAQAAGAARTDCARFYGHVVSRDALSNELLWPYPWLDELARSCMLVGPDARRFVDEGHGGVHIANQIAALPDPAAAVLICDEAAWNGPGTERALSPNPFLQRIGGTVHTAATLSALAQTSGLPAGALEAEVARYNEAQAAGTLAQLAPSRTSAKFRAWPIRRPPFYAIPVAAGITYTMGGIAIDAHSRVMNERGQSIPGLYAAGSCTGGLEGGPRAGYAGGLCKASTTGLRAGEAIGAALGAGPSAAIAAAGGRVAPASR